MQLPVQNKGQASCRLSSICSFIRAGLIAAAASAEREEMDVTMLA